MEEETVLTVPPVVGQAPPPAPPQGEPSPSPTTPPPPGGTPPTGPQGSQPAGASPPPVKKGLPKIVFIIIGFLVLAGIGFAVWKFVLSKPREPEEVTLTWWGLWEDGSLVEPLISEYQAANPKVKINYVNQSKQDYRERLTNALAKGQGPDIFRLHNTWVPMFTAELSPLPAEVMTPTEFSQTFYPVAVSDLTTSEGVVGMPLMYDGLALFINQEIFDAAGKTAPQTWNDLRQTAIELTIKDEQGVIQQAGAALGRTENVDHWPEILALMMVQNGVDLANPTGVLAEDALTYYTVFSLVDGVWDETLPPSTAAFAGGKLAMYFGPSWRIFEIKAQNPNLEFEVMPVPQLPKNTPDEADIAYASYWVEGVWKRSESATEAWKFLKFLAQKDSLQKLYTNAAQTRLFGEPYPRVDMADLVTADPFVSAFVSQAGNATSWYLASRTFDGPTGINSQIGAYFEDAVNAVNQGTRADKALETAAAGVTQVLSQYGLITRSAASQ